MIMYDAKADREFPYIFIMKNCHRIQLSILAKLQQNK